MTEQLNKKQEYQERYRFWSDKRVAQLSFHNNLLLTIGIAIIGYFWSERSSVYTKLIIDCEAEIDWKIVFFILGLVTTGLSVLAGFVLSLSRLYDLRLTSNIALTRIRALDKAVTIQENEALKSGFLKSILALAVVSWNYQKYEIRKTEIGNTEAFQQKFNELRQKASDLGVSTWGLVKWQTLSMLSAFMLFTLTLILK